MKEVIIMTQIIAAAAALVLGAAVAYINSLLSKKALNKDSVTAIMAINFERLFLDALCLFAVYGICKLVKLEFIVPLIAAAVGLSAGGILFLRLMTKKENEKNGGEKRD